MNKATIFLSIVVVFFFGFVLAKAIEKQYEELPTTTIQRMNIERSLSVAGYIEPERVIDVRSSISGTLDQLLVSVGDKVELGKSLASIRFVKDPIEMRQLRDNIEISKRKLETKKAQFTRTKALYDNGMIATEEYEQEETDYEVMLKNHETIVAELAMVTGTQNTNQISNIITATNNGTVIELPVKEGGSVMARGSYSEGSVIARIADFNSMEFVGAVAESDINKIAIGAIVEITMATNPDAVVLGSINEITPTARRNNGIVTYEIHAMIDTHSLHDCNIYSGCSAMAKIVIDRAYNVWCLGEKNIHYRGDSAYVEVVQTNKHIVKKTVSLGLSDGINTQIVSGVDSLTLIKTEE